MFASPPTARLRPGGLLWILLLLLLGGCASAPQSAHLRSAPPPGLAPRAELTDVPFFPQTLHQCGPAALATVLDWSGLHVQPEQLTPAVYVPARKGSLQLELVAAARAQGRVAYVLPPHLKDLLAEVAAGHPVLVLQNLGLSWLPRWHYAVVVGYDLQDGVLVLRSGTERRHRETLALFERTWARGGHWALLALSPGTLPVSASPSPYLAAVAALEEGGDATAAIPAYAGALARWPESRIAAMGLGNAYYRAGDLERAEQAYRRLIERAPDYAPALNNLASVLADRGRWTAAEVYARRALAAGDAHLDRYRDTLQRILKR